MRVQIPGGNELKTWIDWSFVCRSLDDLHRECPITCLICVGEGGAGKLAAAWAIDHSIPVSTLRTPTEMGRAAVKNWHAQIFHVAETELLMAFPGGGATRKLVRQARQAGLAIRQPG
jgi:hypothetical protein